MGAPQPEEIYELTREEGKHRLERPFLEMASTALAAGLDIAMGVTVLTLLQAQLEHLLGRQAAHVVGAVGFGVGFGAVPKNVLEQHPQRVREACDVVGRLQLAEPEDPVRPVSDREG